MILFRTVSKQFGQDSPVLQDLSFQVEKGEFVFLTGPSGSGKTTILRLLTREYTPDSGEIELDGKPLSEVKKNKVHLHRRTIGVVFQDYRLLSEYNIWENIALPLYIAGKPQKEIEERVTHLLELVNLTQKAFLFPPQLSGGESQRISIARALSTAPSIILADEPTGNLDKENSQMILKLLMTINAHGTTVLFATHDTNILSSTPHRQVHLDKGRILKDSKKVGPIEKISPKIIAEQAETTDKQNNKSAEQAKTSTEQAKNTSQHVKNSPEMADKNQSENSDPTADQEPITTITFEAPPGSLQTETQITATIETL